jgi:hypothetical protein
VVGKTSRLLLVVALGLAAGAAAQEFRINTYTTGAQALPAASPLTNGGFVEVWTSTQNGSFANLTARRYDGSGAANGFEFRVNTYTSFDKSGLSAAPLADGGFVLVWQSPGEDGSGAGVYGQRYVVPGGIWQPGGSEFRVNTFTTGDEYAPSAAGDGTGRFVVVWAGANAAGVSNYGIFGQRYGTDGAPVGPEFRVDSATDGGSSPAVAADAKGDFVVVWQRAGGISGRRYSSDGTPLDAQFDVVSAALPPLRATPAVASDAAGGFVVVWDLNYGVEGRRYASSGAPLGSEFTVSTYASVPTDMFLFETSSAPRVAIGPGGDFVVAWNAYHQDTTYWEVLARRYDASGAPSGAAFQVNAYTTGNQLKPVPVYTSQGFLVTWGSGPTPHISLAQDGSQSGVYAERLGFTPCTLGDLDGKGTLAVGDVFYLINYLFAGGPAPVCSGDVTGEGKTDVSDVFYLINYLFAGGPAPL